MAVMGAATPWERPCPSSRRAGKSPAAAGRPGRCRAGTFFQIKPQARQAGDPWKITVAQAAPATPMGDDQD